MLTNYTNRVIVPDMTMDDLIKEFGGRTALAGYLDVSVQAIGNMKARGAMPSRHWATLVRKAAEIGKADVITFEALAELASHSTHREEAA